MPLLLVAYPIFNMYHIYLSLIILLIGYAYIINITFTNEILTDKMCKISIVVLILFVLIQNIMSVVKEMKDFKFTEKEEGAFYGVITSELLLDHIETMSDFIEKSEQKGFNVVVLSHHSNLYMVPLNKNNKNGMDLPFNGNLGKTGEEGLIEKLDLLKNTFVLIIKNEENMFWQESKKAREYIQKDWEKIGEIEIFDIYYKE